MINEEKLLHMIKMASYDTYDSDACRPMHDYTRGDYISRELIKSVLTGTLAFLAVLTLWVLYHLEQLLAEINSMDYVAFGKTVGMRYAVFVGIYLLITYLIYSIRYSRGRKKIKRACRHLHKVNAMYKSEKNAGKK